MVFKSVAVHYCLTHTNFSFYIVFPPGISGHGEADVLYLSAPFAVTRIIRVISQLRGNMLVVGVGGSGRRSLSKIAAFICQYQVFQVEVTKQYRKLEFREGEVRHTTVTFADFWETAIYLLPSS